MNADASGSTAVIDRMRVRWQAQGFTGVGSSVDALDERLIDPSRLDRLTGDLLAGPLADALAKTGVGRGELVCLRSVIVPPTAVRWDRSDGDVVAAWAGAVAAAVAESAGRGSSHHDVVRYRSAEEAVIDLAVRAVGGDVRQAWAWQQLGLWPADIPTEATTALDSADAAATVLARHPEQVIAALVALARSGGLPEALARWGVERSVALVAMAWVAHGGDQSVVTGDHTVGSSPGRAPELAAVTVATSILGRAAAAAIGCHPAAMVDRVGQPSAPGSPRSLRSPARLARALAAASVLDAQPGVVSHTSEVSEVVAALTERLVGAQVVSEAAGPAADPGRELPESGLADEHDREAAEAPPRDASSAQPAADASIPEAEGVEETYSGLVAPPTTAWGGLLFVLHVVADLVDLADRPDLGARPGETDGVPIAHAQAGALAWPLTRTALHRLALTLATRALPDADPPAPRDPALLAFAGLAPDAAPPEPGADEEPASVTHARADAVVSALRARLDASALGQAPESALLAAVLRRSATVSADPGWLDVVLDLDQISVAVRRAGLDLDLGWIPWLGRVVRFRYV